MEETFTPEEQRPQRTPEEQKRKTQQLEQKLIAPVLGGEVAWKEISRLERLLLRKELKSSGPFEFRDGATGMRYACRRQSGGIIEVSIEDRQEKYRTNVTISFDTNTGTIKEAWKTLQTFDPVDQTDSMHPTLTEVHALIYRLEIGSGIAKPKPFVP